MVTGQYDHAKAEANTRRVLRERGEEDLWGGGVTDLLVEMVLGNPEGVESGLFGSHRLGESIPMHAVIAMLIGGPGLGLLHLMEEPELHLAPRAWRPTLTAFSMQEDGNRTSEGAGLSSTVQRGAGTSRNELEQAGDDEHD